MVGRWKFLRLFIAQKKFLNQDFESIKIFKELKQPKDKRELMDHHGHSIGWHQREMIHPTCVTLWLIILYDCGIIHGSLHYYMYTTNYISGPVDLIICPAFVGASLNNNIIRSQWSQV